MFQCCAVAQCYAVPSVFLVKVASKNTHASTVYAYLNVCCCHDHVSLQAVPCLLHHSVHNCAKAIQFMLFAPMAKLLLCMAHWHTSGSVLLMQVSIMSAIRHPNVVLFMGVCLDPPCMVTEVGPPSLCTISIQLALPDLIALNARPSEVLPRSLLVLRHCCIVNSCLRWNT